MLRNYLKIALRNLLKHQVFSVINISGLSVGIACALLISLYVSYERSYESYHENADNIYRMSLELYEGPQLVLTDAMTYFPMGEELVDKYPEVLNCVRLMPWEKTQITANGKSLFEEDLYFSDASIFDVFSFKLLDSHAINSFNEPYKAVITESIARKFFDQTDVVGEVFYFNNEKEPLEIVGVVKDFPANSHLKFEILISHETINRYIDWYADHSWSGNNEYTYLLMQSGTSVSAFNEKLLEYSKNNKHIKNEIFIAEAVKDIHLYSNKSFEPGPNGDAEIVDFVEIIGVLILLIAWVNYINLTTSRSIERAKEVGVRKVVGSSKFQITIQFFIEALLINIISALLAFTVVQLIFPLFRDIAGLPSEALRLNNIILEVTGLVILGTIISGIYPALILSNYKPVTVLKGKLRNSSKGIFWRKGLVIFQFISAVILIGVSLAVYYQMNFMTNKSLGIEIDNTLVVHQPIIQDESTINLNNKMRAFEHDLEDRSIVSAVAQSDVLPGADIKELSSTTGATIIGSDNRKLGYNYYAYMVNEDYFETLGIDFIAGRNFKYDEEQTKFVINEKAAELLGFDNPEEIVGRKISFGGDEGYDIVGVIENFYQRSPKEELMPMLFDYATTGFYYSIKLDPKINVEKAIAEIKSVWGQHFPNSAFDYEFLDEEYNKQYINEERFAVISLIFTCLAVMISVLGLFGLVTYTIAQRTKEVGIRKVLGASMANLIKLLSKDYLILVIIASVIAVPIVSVFVSSWLENYYTRIELDWWFYIIPVIIIFLISICTVVVKVMKSVRVNPIDSLRYE